MQNAHNAALPAAVILPSEEYEDMMDDLAMGRAARESKAEPRRPLADVVKELRASGEIDV
jgi:PHD/YefM family antitoxin component YafN of YafNO toxin-antitoxin module